MTSTPDHAHRAHGDPRGPLATIPGAAALRNADPAASIDWDAVDIADLLRIPDLDVAGSRADEVSDSPSIRRSRRRRAATGVGGAVALLAAGGLAAAAAAGFFDGPRPEVVGVQCRSGSTTAGLGAIGSGSPIDACVKAWQELGPVPNDLVMASLPGQVVIVAPRDEVPPGATVLDAAPAIDARTAELSDALQDEIRGVGPGATCRSADDVQRRIGEITGALGLHDIPVTRSEEGGSCAFAAPTPDGHGILLFLRPPPQTSVEADWPGAVEASRGWRLYIGDLRRLTQQPGVSVEELKAGAEAAARHRLDIGAPGKEPFRVDIVPTTVGSSPRLYLRGGGPVQIYAPQ
ncbi:hypothetical protein BJY21_002404 [Kineosphaera limosa]|uniref:Uncharacterized protein n=1 Tax=Kineosphaera limosa NBRC 100340 TaxID=1184609 RepID=K6XCN5_9MICO|nr:hypothetical protein [Kineosphaera limosa]NYE01220.1 hypothetical protein [Kineosphaera limosa]GAB96579.1 hypothetical protein KILIM_042_00230 [Kineosphaera limosa NBRC 100340]